MRQYVKKLSYYLKRLFLPLILILVLVATYLYWKEDHPTRPQSIREAVPVEHFTLSNGLEVVVMPNHRTNAVVHMLIVKAGAADDPYGKTGIAHYLEHLMFSGSTNYPEGTYDSTIQKLGGEQNAYTTKDYTAYHVMVAREHLPTIMAMESDRLQNLLFEPTKVTRELKVITEERNQRIENSPVAQFMEQLDALTYLNHPYHHPTIGWAEDMAVLTGEDARSFFNYYYRASNLVLVVSGDVTTADIRKDAQRYYGSLPAGSAPVRNWPKDPPFRMTRHATMTDANVHEPRIVRQYLAPSLGDGVTTNALPLALFAQYLGGGDSSLLYQRLVREQHLASNVDVSYDVFAIGPELFQISAIPAPGTTPEQLEKALDTVLKEALSKPPELAAFTRAKTQSKAEAIFAQDGLFPLTNLIASLYARGLDEQTFYNWQTTIETITPEQSLAAAMATLQSTKAVTGYLLPAPAPSPVIVPQEPQPSEQQTEPAAAPQNVPVAQPATTAPGATNAPH